MTGRTCLPPPSGTVPAKRRPHHFILEGAIVLVLAVVSATMGIVNLNQGRTKVGTEQHEPSAVFTPSAMFACGHGFVNPQINQLPGVDDFFNLKRNDFPAALPEKEFVAVPLDTFQSLHLNMIVLVGLAWRVFGVSWIVVKWLLALVLALCAVLAYRLFRLGMNRCISFAGALLFVSSPVVLLSMHSLRSLSKMFFILAVLLVLGRMIKRPPSRKGYWLGAAGVGILIGVGAGFRQDAMVCLLPAIVVLASCPVAALRRGIVERTAATALLLTACFACASPVLGANREHGTPSHDMTMGLSEVSDAKLGMTPASYSKSYLPKDSLVWASINSHARRITSPDVSLKNFTAAYNAAGLRYVLDNVVAFPADFITRAYAAVLTGLTHFDPPRPALLGLKRGPSADDPVYAKTRLWGLGAAAAALLLLLRQSWYRGAMVLFLAAYFLGYTSILYDYRHVFHLSFVPIWFLGYCVQRAVSALRARRLRLPFLRKDLLRSGMAAEERRMLAGTLGAAALALIPLYGARAWQDHQMGRMRNQYDGAKLSLLKTEPRTCGRWMLFSPAEPLSGRRYAYHDMVNPEPMPTPGDYLVARFKSADRARGFRICYERADFNSDYSWSFSMPAESPAAGGSSLYYFPVYETPAGLEGIAGNSFAGIAVPAADAEDFLGLYRVENADRFRLWPVFAVPGSTRDFKGHQTIDLMHADSAGATGNRTGETRRADSTATVAEGNASLNAAGPLSLGPYDPEQYLASAKALEDRGDMGAAADVYMQGLSVLPGMCLFYIRLDKAWRSLADSTDRISKWDALVSAHPENADAHYWLGRSYQEAGDSRNALAAYADAVRCDPRVAAFHRALGNALAGEGCGEEALSSVMTAALLAPTDVDVLYDQARILHAMEYPAQALACCGRALALSPETPDLAILADGIFGSANGYGQRTAFWRGVAGGHPDAIQPRIRLGMALEASGDLRGAIDEYRTVHEANPADAAALTRMGSALLAAGDTAQGGDALDQALRVSPNCTWEVAEACAGFAKRLADGGRNAEAADWYRKAADTAPMVLQHRIRLAETLEAQKLGNEALKEYRRVLLEEPESSSPAQRADALLLKGKSPEERVAFWREITAAHPSAAIPSLYLGMALEAAGDADGARAEYRRTQDANPKDAQAVIRLGGALLAAGDMERGEEALGRALRANPNYRGEVAEAYAGLAKRLSGDGRLAEAADWLRKAADTAPSNLSHHVNLAETLEAAGMQDEAAGEYRRVLLAAPESPRSAQKLDVILVERKSPEERLSSWREIAAAHPNAAVPSLYLGMALEAAGDLGGALAAYGRAHDASPKDISVLVRLGSALLAAGDLKRGEESLEQALRAGPNCMGEIAQVYAQLAKRFSDGGRLAEAVDWCRKAAAAAPSDLSHRIRLAEALEARELHDEAAGEYRGVLMAAPQSPRAAQRLDATLAKKRTPEERVAFWREIAAAHPESAIPSLYLGMALETTGDLNGGLAEYRKAHDADPENALALVRLGGALLAAGDTVQGEKALGRALHANEDYRNDVAEAYARLAKRLSDEGKHAEAADWQRKAADTAPANLAHRVRLAEILETGERYDEAVKEYRRVLMTTPESPHSAERLDGILVKRNMLKERTALWREIAAAHPDAELPARYLKMAGGDGTGQ